jgi:protein TonB
MPPIVLDYDPISTNKVVAMQKRLGPALVTSFAWHLVMLLLVVGLVRFGGTGTPLAVVTPDQTTVRLVWLAEAGPGGGGGGGGNRRKEPPRPAEAPGHDAVTVPVAPKPTIQPLEQPAPEPPPNQTLDIPARSLATSITSLPGALDVPPGPPTTSQGPGSDGGAGSGSKGGNGPGKGLGLGRGLDRGVGDGPYQIGNDVTRPIEVRKGVPQYTSDAMRARVQGSVIVECVVQATGLCSDIRVVRSLEPSFGLNDEAMKAARQWRFRPGTRKGEPVPVVVTLEVEFTLR